MRFWNAPQAPGNLVSTADVLTTYGSKKKLVDRYFGYLIKHYPGMNAKNLVDGKSTLVEVMAWCR